MNKAPELGLQQPVVAETTVHAAGVIAVVPEATAYTGAEDAGAAMSVGNVVLGDFNKRTSEDTGAGWRD